VGLKSAEYCDKKGNQIANPLTQRMQPYYFPFIQGRGQHLPLARLRAAATSWRMQARRG